MAAPWVAAARGDRVDERRRRRSAARRRGRARRGRRRRPGRRPPGRGTRPRPSRGASPPPATTATTATGSHGAPATLGRALRRGHDDDRARRPASPRCASACGRAAGGRRSARPACRRRPSGCEEPAATTIASARRPGTSGAAQSSRGWAKIIRPATVWSTRVTATSRSLSMCRAPPSTTIIVPSSRKPTPWPGLLALLDDPDPQLLAGQDGRLHGVGQRVDVHDPDALELGDPVEVEVVGQDDPAARPREGDELGVDLGDRPGTSSSTISTGVAGSFCIRARISSPRRPRLRRSVSELSAMCWSSSRTKRGTTSVP